MINNFRKKKKITVLLLLVATVLMLCTGCVRSGVGVIIEPDDTGVVEISIGINEKYMETLKEEFGGSDPFEGKNTSVLTDGGERYICALEYKSFRNLEELEEILLGLEYDFEWLDEEYSESESAEEEVNYHIFKSAEVTHTSNFFGDKYKLSLITMPHETEDDLSLIGINSDDFFKLVIAVTMPGEITAEGAEITGNTASFKIVDLSKEQVLNVAGSTTNVKGMIAVGVSMVVLIIVFILVLKRKKPAYSMIFN